VFLFSHLTYFMHLLYLAKLQDLNISKYKQLSVERCVCKLPTYGVGWPKKMNVKKFCISPPKVVPFIEKKNCAKYLFNMTIFRGGPSWS